MWGTIPKTYDTTNTVLRLVGGAAMHKQEGNPRALGQTPSHHPQTVIHNIIHVHLCWPKASVYADVP